MSAATKVTIAIVVLFAAVLGVYYGFGGPDGTAAVPPELLPPAEQDPVASATPVPDPPASTPVSEPTAGTLANSIEQALWAQGESAADTAAPGGGDVTPAPENPWVLRAPALSPQPEAREPASRGGAVAQTRTVEYIVQPDDSMWMIAKRWFGDPNRWREIARGNPDVNPDRLRVGQRLQLPAHDDAGGVGLNQPASIKPARVTTSAPAGPARYYTVESGDTLSTIADQYYDSETRWHEIYEANRTAIGGNPDRLKVGMRLRIP